MTKPAPAQEFFANRGDGIAAWRKIADHLEAEIAGGLLAPGGQLPTEAVLATRFTVNRHTVRRALAELADKGLVRTAQGRGTFVEAARLAYPIGTRTRFSQNMAQEGREPGGVVLDAAEIEADARIAGLLAIPPGSLVLRLHTARLADGVPIAIGHSHFPLPRFAGFEAAYRRFGAVTPSFAAYGVDDYKRRETRVSARFASPEEATGLDIAPGRPVMVVDSINVDLDGVPIQATRGVFAADRAEIVLQS
ncbi:putative HTH-type transcriptional regulator RB1450 [Labrys miyagiensis]|uniref:HTH-type transcriptional regulator RB1450 n=1 Tax=Labrys miyagiensis TaxID=346912 RepID=A0ABQ6CV08_9HYPH|nr:phosphonate metabolism transcriptional regulator PhnF [Labrys miyagiensis]GLS23960.1 putative HTH-type transcriptional regulator RB1450 [Labrys miyagiensis]